MSFQGPSVAIMGETIRSYHQSAYVILEIICHCDPSTYTRVHCVLMEELR